MRVGPEVILVPHRLDTCVCTCVNMHTVVPVRCEPDHVDRDQRGLDGTSVSPVCVQQKSRCSTPPPRPLLQTRLGAGIVGGHVSSVCACG